MCVCVFVCVGELRAHRSGAVTGQRRRGEAAFAMPTPIVSARKRARGASAQRSLSLHHRMMSNAVRGVHVSGLQLHGKCFSPPAPPVRRRRRPCTSSSTRATRTRGQLIHVMIIDKPQTADRHAARPDTGLALYRPLQSRDNPAPKPTSHLSLRVCDLHPDCVKYL